MAYDPFAGCPLPTALATVPDSTCPLRLDQVVAFAIRRKNSTPLFTVTGSAGTLITSSGAWTDPMALTTAGKLIITPLFSGFTIPESEPVIEDENSNTSIGGLGHAFPGPPVRGTGKLENKQAAQITVLRGYMKEFSNFTSIRGELYMINRFGQVFGKDTGAGIEFTNFTVGGRSTEGYNKNDMNSIGITLPYGWDENLAMYTPLFDLLALAPK